MFAYGRRCFKLVLLVERLKSSRYLGRRIRDSYSVKFVKALQGNVLEAEDWCADVYSANRIFPSWYWVCCCKAYPLH